MLGLPLWEYDILSISPGEHPVLFQNVSYTDFAYFLLNMFGDHFIITIVSGTFTSIITSNMVGLYIWRICIYILILYLTSLLSYSNFQFISWVL